jgi:gliding motility-associated-like protein
LPGTACYSGDSIIKIIHPTAGTYDLQFTVSQINCNQSVVVTTAGATSATASINFGDGDVVILGGDQSYVHNFVNNNTMPDSIYITLSNLYCVKTTAYAVNPVLNKDIDTALVICSKKKQVQLDGLPGMTNYIWDNTIYLNKQYGQLVMFDPTNFPGGDITCTEQYQSSGNNNCYRRVRYNINFSVNASLEMNVIPNVTAINLGDEVELTATPYGGINYQWQPVGIMQSNGSNKVIAKPTTDTTIVLYIADPKTPACDLRIAIPIQVEEFPCDEGSIDIANCVTPNGDLVNDYVMAHTAIVKDYRLLIYNRWGNVVFETNDPNEKWRATCNGKDCDDGVYGYMASSTCLNGKTILKKGNITVIR